MAGLLLQQPLVEELKKKAEASSLELAGAVPARQELCQPSRQPAWKAVLGKAAAGRRTLRSSHKALPWEMPREVLCEGTPRAEDGKRGLKAGGGRKKVIKGEGGVVVHLDMMYVKTFLY